VVSELDWPLRRHHDLIAGVQEYADDRGWAVEVGRFPELRMEAGVRFDGMVGRIESGTFAAAEAAKIPVVNCWLNSPVAQLTPNVHIDPFAIGRMAAEHLIARGLRQLVAVGLQRRPASRHFCAGTAAAAGEHGVTCREYKLSPAFESRPQDWRRLVAGLEAETACWKAPMGLAVWSDSMGRAVLTILQDLGWRVPEDIALVGTGNEPLLSTTIRPTLSSIDPGHRRVGHEAAALLERLMRGQPAPSETIFVPPKELVVRASSDVFAVRDRQVQRALRFMADNSHQTIGVADIADVTELSRQVLERRFRQELGTTINNELLRLRVERLKRLLVETDTPVKELGGRAGFGTPANMFQVFKSRTGLTPAAYREQHADPRQRI
jgi:LacI family transcriptional regulator